jgi:hypothetical protein
VARVLIGGPWTFSRQALNAETTLIKPVRYAVALAAVLVSACAPVAEPIIAPVPEGAAGATAPRPLVQPVQPPQEYTRAVQGNSRSANGAPGSRYWQQGVRYNIEASLDPETRQLTGRERIVYRNRSPNTLPYVVFNLYQNLFRTATGGLNLTRLAVGGQALTEFTEQATATVLAGGPAQPGYFVRGTLGRVYLPRPLAPGDSTVFEVEWNFRVPPNGAPRTAFEDALGGRVLAVAQWYPQIATYDDVQGFDTTPYTGQGEFYLEYGDFDYTLTLPSGWLVGGTGTLQNADQVLTPTVRQRLDQAMRTDSVVRVVTAAEVGRGTVAGQNGRVTWRFNARNVRDVAFSTSNRYLWDATRATIPAPTGGGTTQVAVHSLYRPGAPHWENAARYTDHAMEFWSRELVPYIYPQITNTEGPVYGMEYPMVIFVGRPQTAEELYEVSAHEVGHEWFPMMVGQDEAAHAFMDEGFTTFYERLAVADFLRPQDPWAQPRQPYLQIAGQRAEATLMKSADQMTDFQMGVAAYYKPGLVMRALRATLGDETFDRAMRTYSNEWQLKHPYPWDFFNTVERVAGRDLDWFWYPWFYTTATNDLAIARVTPGAGSVAVTVRDVGQVPSPAFLVVTTSGGQRVRQTIPIESFLTPGTREVTVNVPVTGSVTRVDLDPEYVVPDVNRRNNAWTP